MVAHRGGVRATNYVLHIDGYRLRAGYPLTLCGRRQEDVNRTPTQHPHFSPEEGSAENYSYAREELCRACVRMYVNMFGEPLPRMHQSKPQSAAGH